MNGSGVVVDRQWFERDQARPPQKINRRRQINLDVSFTITQAARPGQCRVSPEQDKHG